MSGAMNEDWQENARMIVDSARAVVPADGNLDRIRKARFHGSGFDRDVMRQAAELGWLLMRVKEDSGGLGLGMRETCALMELLGGGLVPEPVLSSIMAASLLQEALPEAALAGEAVIVTAWQDRTGAQDWRGGSAGGRLLGQKLNVPGAAGADLFAVITGDGIAVVPRDANGLTVAGEETLDGGRTGLLTFNGVEVDFLPCDRVERVLQDARLAHSAYLLGLSERALAITLDYLRVRKQFDRPIGSFQSLQHRATEMKIRLELARAAIYATARRFDTGADDRTCSRDAARCKLRAADLAMLVAREAVQMHGAMGITDEADIGLYVRKAMTEANLFGGPRQQRATLAALLDQEDAA
ncbi:acyl-CoA dehydrogenase family protein [Roseibium marinum]|uniref:Alkylation response protein AidB-like acyl-CoA dehydrogenase n=1 Tax=Roseibium marinum TaxID=281252 RepID=A0A2S3UWU7_9HYPH|nr:acyl-CoA dehydrogenase family protein [Roseibium marinum]POF32185.1 alkylation response protein AidB-like acyl-CoA dehydrogenase [Roseibium marinum]